MINLPSAIKLTFYLIQCAICFCFIFAGSGPGQAVFDNLDLILSCPYFTQPNSTRFFRSEDSLDFEQRTVMMSVFVSVPALILWVIALFLVNCNINL